MARRSPSRTTIPESDGAHPKSVSLYRVGLFGARARQCVDVWALTPAHAGVLAVTGLRSRGELGCRVAWVSQIAKRHANVLNAPEDVVISRSSGF